MSRYFVGRERELAMLARVLDSSAAGEGRVVVVSGEAGIGKTRLLSEVSRIADARGRLVLWSQMIEDPAAPPYFAWILALRECINTCDDEALREDLGSGAADIGDMLPELRDRLSLPRGRPAANVAQYQVFDSITRFLNAAARRRPLVVLLDNLHFADASSLALLEYYAHSVRTAPVVVVCAYRSELAMSAEGVKATFRRLACRVSVEQLQLCGLGRDSVAELLRLHVGRAVSPAIVDSIHSQSDGNPLFVSEVGAMLGAGRPSRMPQPKHSFRVPDTLRELIDARLGELPESLVRLLGKAAVLGREFNAPALAAVSGWSITAVLNSLERAESEGVITEIGPARFRFHHALFREVLYGGLSTLRRVALHRRAAEYLETTSGSDLMSHLSQLAHHHFEAAQLDRADDAVRHCIRAGDAAMAQRAFAEAAIQYERAIQAMEAEQNAGKRFDVLMKYGDAQYRSAQVDSASESVLEAAMLANLNRWWRRLAEALIMFQQLRAALGVGHVASVPLHETVLARLPDEEVSLRARALVSLATALRHAGRSDHARTSARQGIALARQLGDRRVLATCLAHADYAYCDPLVVGERLSMAREMIALAEEIADPEAQMEGLKNMLLALLDKGEIDEALGCMTRLRSVAQAERHPHYLALVSGVETAYSIMKGHWEDAIERALASQRSAPLYGMVGLEGRFGFQVFSIYKARGLLDSVSAIFASVVANAETAALWLPGQILLHSELGQRDEGLAALDRIGDPARLPRDDLYLTILIYLAEACASLGDRRRCGRIYELLLPFRGLNASLAGTLLLGAVSGYLAPLAALLRRTREARLLFEEAIAMNERMGAAVELPRNKVGLAALLLNSNRAEERSRAGNLLDSARAEAAALDLGPVLKRIDSLEEGAGCHDNLSRRELQVLQLIAEGASNRKIAASLFVSTNTVATHVRSILRKVGAANRTEAANYARRHDLVSS